ncbi:MAG: hypothetical protein KJ041_08595, partial [Gammaproteobacteria bacterium]|nr:hypothetical protein [Gammaproteobacteria bacterium]
RPEPGLGRFHSGAFTAAARGQLPVVPVVIRGSRWMMPAERILPRPGRLEIIIKPPLFPTGDAPTRALLEQARQSILADLGEPDLLTPDRT